MMYYILGSLNYANRRLVYEFEQYGKEAVIIDPSLFIPFVNDKRDDRLYFQGIEDEPIRVYKKHFKGVIPRIGKNLQYHAKTVEHIVNNIGIPTTATAQGLLNAQDKFLTTQLLSQNGIKTPKTFTITKVKNPQWLTKMLGGFPVVAKVNYGSQGVGVFLLTEALSAATALSTFAALGHNLILQEFIETAKDDKKKHDFRAVVVDGVVVAAIKRNSVGGDFRTNTSIKEDCEGVELDDNMKEVAIKAAQAVGLSVAGVDLAQHYETKEIYCYEVNGNMNFKSTEKFSKKNVAKAIVEYALKVCGEMVIEASRKPLSNFNAQNGKGVGIPFLEFPTIDDEHDDIEMSSNGTAKPIRLQAELFKKEIGEKSIFSSPIKN